jgi:nicotinate-nucleotide adenylyltransferase
MVEPASRKRRVAFFGGSFDPPHLGHLAIARAAREALGLDTVLFAPVGAQPLKPHGSTASFSDRVAMTKLAIAGESGFAVSLADAPNPEGKPNYTLETLQRLRADLPAGSDLFCLMGADSFLSLRLWRGAAQIPFAASLIVASRPGQALNDLAAVLPEGLSLESESPTGGSGIAAKRASPSAALDSDGRLPVDFGSGLRLGSVTGHDFSRATHGQHDDRASAPAEGAPAVHTYLLFDRQRRSAPFYVLPGLDVEISASAIRRQMRETCRAEAEAPDLVPQAVANYIRAHGLYG